MRFSQSLCVSFIAALLLRLPGSVSAQPLVAPTDAHTPQEEARSFHLPPGFVIQLVAAEPDIHKPMNIAFDARGRLWVTDTIEYPWPVSANRDGRDTVKVLEDFADDGRARRITTFADKLNIPIGVLPLPGGNGVIAHSIPNVWRFLDTDGDGKADKRDVLYGSIGFTDTHGMTNAFTYGHDGWVYACHGFSNTSTVKAADGSQITMNSGNVFRFKPDGSRVEQVTHGQVNPFGLCFDPLGNLFSADCHTRPQYMLLRGAYYPSFGKPDDGLGFGPEMCPHDHGSTGIAGTVYYDADNFPQPFRGTLFNGNPVTGRINHDKLKWTGSSPMAIEQPDFLSSDDPWFRPVDLEIGPDGALYVADFYNQIIGHYEVRLDHPGRDRHRGRIWRIAYVGQGGKASAPTKAPDLLDADVAALVNALGADNIAVRTLAAEQVVARIGKNSVVPLRQALASSHDPTQKVHILWALHRLGGFEQGTLTGVYHDAATLPVVRTHVMRILSETRDWVTAHRGLALAGLKDENPFVRRAAADALAEHPSVDHVRPLLDARQKVPADDPQLLHQIRIALRDQLQPDGTLSKLPVKDWPDADQKAIADVALGVTANDVGGFLVEHVEKFVNASGDRELAARYLRHAARFLPEARVDALAALVTGRFAEDIDFQLALYKSVREGLAQRAGLAPTAGMRQWGTKLAGQLLDAARPDADTWTRLPLPGKNSARPAPSPWFIELRESNDGVKDKPFWSSLPPGGEQLTGVIRSEPFEVPAQLSFFTAGHNGPPGETLAKSNVMRLLDAKSGEELAHAYPPRDDVAKKVTWDLKKFAGRSAVFEATDGQAGTGFAWLAFGRFEPPVVKLPRVGPDVVRTRQQAAAEIAGALRLTALESRLGDLLSGDGVDAQARAAAARALAAISPDRHVRQLGQIAADPTVPPVLRDAVSQALGELNSADGRAELAAALAVAPRQLQTSIALALARSTSGAETLLKAVEDGKASPRLLLEPAVRARLDTAKPADLEKRVAQLTRGQAAPGDEVQRVIDQRRSGFDPATASAQRGGAVFATNCAVCHQIKGEGVLIGPHLDGIGKRGIDRLAEDVLDPNRNVDAAFRQTILQLTDGDSVAGLLRREEGEQLVLADSAGKEIVVPRSKVRRRAPSTLSPMPSNFAETMPPNDFNDLMAFLLGS